MKVQYILLLYFFAVHQLCVQSMDIVEVSPKKPKKTVKTLLDCCAYTVLNKFLAEMPEQIQEELLQLNNDIKDYLAAILNKPLNKDYGHTRLHKACTPLRVRRLLAIGANTRALTYLQETPLHSLLKENKVVEAIALLENAQVVDVNHADADGIMPLQLALSLSNIHLVELLHKRGAQIAFLSNYQIVSHYCRNIVGSKKNTLENEKIEAMAHYCMMQSTLEECKHCFLQLSQSIQKAIIDFLNRPITWYGHTYFHLAKTESEVQKLLSLHANYKMLTNMRETPLHSMIKCGNRNAAFTLLPYLQKNDCNTVDASGLTPLCSAVRVGDTKLVLELLKKKAEVAYKYDSQEGCRSPFHFIVPHSKKYKIMNALFNKAGTRIPPGMRIALMCLAVEYDNAYMLTRLIPKGYTLDSFFVNNVNLVMYAVTTKREVCLQKLLSGEVRLCEVSSDGKIVAEQTNFIQPNLSVANTQGVTALMLAAAHGNCESIQHMIDLAASVHAIDQEGDVALIYAIINEQLGAFELLLHNGTDINHANNLGATPLHFAVDKENFKMVELLIQAGADPTKADVDGKTPLHIAQDKWKLSIVKCLRNVQK